MRYNSTRQHVLAFIKGYIKEWGFPPSIAEIGQGVGLSSPSSVVYQLGELEAEGLIVRPRGRVRAIKVIDKQEVTGRGVVQG